MNRLSRVSGIVFRNFSADAKHAPPKKIHGIGGRYAGAVYTAASKAGLLEKVETELHAFSDVLKKNQKFSSFLSNPTVAREAKCKLVSDITGESSTFSYITSNFLLTLAANGRISETIKISKSFFELMEIARGNVNAKVITAEPLNKKQVAAVETAVLAMVGKNKKVDLTFAEDPSILGGLQVLIGDTVMDLSVATRVTDLSLVIDGQDS